MGRISIEEFDRYVKSSALSQYLFHYSDQNGDTINRNIKMSVSFSKVEVAPEFDLIKFSSKSGVLFANHVNSVAVKESTLGATIEIFCDCSAVESRTGKIVLFAT